MGETITVRHGLFYCGEPQKRHSLYLRCRLKLLVSMFFYWSIHYHYTIILHWKENACVFLLSGVRSTETDLFFLCGCTLPPHNSTITASSTCNPLQQLLLLLLQAPHSSAPLTSPMWWCRIDCLSWFSWVVIKTFICSHCG